MNAGLLGFNNMMHAMHEYHLLTSWGKRKKKHIGGKKKRKKKDRVFARPSLKLSPFMLSQLSNTVYQRIELT